MDNFTLLAEMRNESSSSSSTACMLLENEDVELDLEFLEKKKYMQWIAYRIIGPGVVGIGLLGNVLNLLVLTRPSLKGVTYTYLIGLACSDIGVLLCAGSDERVIDDLSSLRRSDHHRDEDDEMIMFSLSFGEIKQLIVSLSSSWPRSVGGDGWHEAAAAIRQSRFDRENSWGVTFFYAHLEYPLANTFMASSIYIVLCLTVDRFASVCLPTRFKEFHTSDHSKRAMAAAAVLAILVTHELAWRIYIYSAEMVVRFGPATILAVLNFLIIFRFRQITERRREMLAGGVELAEGNSQLLLRGERISKKIYKEEKRLVTLLSAIVLLFFVTTTPVAILGISYSQSLDRNLYFQLFRAIANVLELCNFALNFYVYFLCSKEFRKKFLSFFTVLLPPGRMGASNNGVKQQGQGGGRSNNLGGGGGGPGIAMPEMPGHSHVQQLNNSCSRVDAL
ncbi:putative G-protein coupled receptor AH9.1 [Folsomia candida]|uniref:Putative G-protein coupled receptor AH9.1 n=1 Tax=Folsomia candida TaxID=158441 RepID=A0A226EVM8_FOLCA|nr:putative G-protein coupled receptor AH9.1 [Folsomia candida]